MRKIKREEYDLYSYNLKKSNQWKNIKKKNTNT